MSLKAGWNSVYLEVEPTERKPDEVFGGVAVDVVARYFTLATAVQYISNPADQPWKSEGWGVWYAPGREDAFLSNLHAVQGNCCYLIHATEDTTWEVTGSVRMRRMQWRQGSFNLFGASVEREGAPSFGAYFSGSGGKIGSKIYRLVEGTWVKVSADARMRAGEACWVYCEGSSSYPGPLEVKVRGEGGVDFGTSGEVSEILVRNVSGEAVNVRVELEGAGEGARLLPLRRVVSDLGKLETTYVDAGVPVSIEGVEPGSVATLRYQLRREEMTGESGAALLKISTDRGVVIWVPVLASDLSRSAPN